MFSAAIAREMVPKFSQVVQTFRSGDPPSPLPYCPDLPRSRQSDYPFIRPSKIIEQISNSAGFDAW